MVTTAPEAMSLPVPAASPIAVVSPTAGRTVVGRMGRISRTHRRSVVVGVDLLATAVVGLALQLSVASPQPVLALPVLWPALLAWTGAFRAPGVVPVLRAGALLGLLCWTGWSSPADVTARPGPMLLTGGLVAVSLVVRRLAGTPDTRVLLVGDRPAVDLAVGEIGRPGHGFVLAGVATDGTDSAADVADLATRAEADAVLVLPGPHLDALRLRRLGWELDRRGTGLYVGTGLLDVRPARTSHVALGDLGMLHVRGVGRPGPQRLLKEVVERGVAAVALVVLAPVLLGLVALVRGSTGGSALFRQVRIGRDGRPFTMLKLRTMAVGSDRPDITLTARNEVTGGVLFKLRDDPRVTRVGRLLRRYSLDELPQLVNVLRGDMALIGPRPALPEEVEQYAADPLRRLVVRPGLTGLWQVSGRSDLSWEETVRLDLTYVDNWSLGLDARIALRTVRAVLGHRGAY